MPQYVICRFCGQQAPTHDHDKCAILFGAGLKQELLDFAYINPESRLPDRITKKMSGINWEGYQEYLKRVERDLNTEKMCSVYGTTIQQELQVIADKRIKELCPLFHVHVSVTCTKIPTY